MKFLFPYWVSDWNESKRLSGKKLRPPSQKLELTSAKNVHTKGTQSIIAINMTGPLENIVILMQWLRFPFSRKEKCALRGSLSHLPGRRSDFSSDSVSSGSSERELPAFPPVTRRAFPGFRWWFDSPFATPEIKMKKSLENKSFASFQFKKYREHLRSLLSPLADMLRLW